MLDVHASTAPGGDIRNRRADPRFSRRAAAAVVFDFQVHAPDREPGRRDAAARTARVQPGVICDQLRGVAAEHGLTFSVDPATHDRCTLGGMTVDNVIELDVMTCDGTRMTVGTTSPQEYERIVAAGGRRAEICGLLLVGFRNGRRPWCGERIEIEAHETHHPDSGCWPATRCACPGGWRSAGRDTGSLTFR